MNIVADTQIPRVEQAFSQFGEVTFCPGRDIDAERVRSCDILLVRSVTRINHDLLAHSRVRFIASATSGIDHVDVNYLRSRNIGFASAPGCNARAVAEYVLSALLDLAAGRGFRLAEKTVGIIGYGHTGSRVARFLDALGVKCVINDPPLADNGGVAGLQSLDAALACDIITLHVPLTTGGDHPTIGLLDRRRIENLRNGTIVVNTARGEVLDEAALLDAVRAGRLHAVIDVWQNEPSINTGLLAAVHTGTPHIAGYSLDGRLRAVGSIYLACCNYFNEPAQFSIEHPASPGTQIVDATVTVDELIRRLTHAVCPVTADHAALCKSLAMDDPARRAAYFDQLRRNYPDRREFSSVSVQARELPGKTLRVLEALGFAVCRN